VLCQTVNIVIQVNNVLTSQTQHAMLSLHHLQ